MLVGNDIVDLQDSDAKLEGLHRRFLCRVFSPAEQGAIGRARCHSASLWAYWTAKEAAFKVVRKLDPQVIFAQRRFDVELEPLIAGQRSFGVVRHEERVLLIEMACAVDWVHATALFDPRTGRNAPQRSADRAATSTATIRQTASRAFASIVRWIRPCIDPCEPSAAVRLAAREAVAKHAGWSVAEITIAGSRPPRVLRAGQPTHWDLSLSHHGRWIALAATAVGD